MILLKDVTLTTHSRLNTGMYPTTKGTSGSKLDVKSTALKRPQPQTAGRVWGQAQGLWRARPIRLGCCHCTILSALDAIDVGQAIASNWLLFAMQHSSTRSGSCPRVPDVERTTISRCNINIKDGGWFLCQQPDGIPEGFAKTLFMRANEIDVDPSKAPPLRGPKHNENGLCLGMARGGNAPPWHDTALARQS